MSGDGTGGMLPGGGVGRRSVLRGLGAGAVAAGAGGLVAACSAGSKGPGGGSPNTITVGFITPLTGSLAGFASGDKFVLDTVRATSAYAKGFKVGGKTYRVNVIAADSQSDPTRASQLARQLILNNNVDLLLATSTPETTNPVAVVAQTEGVPCLSTVVPWESWYTGLDGNPLKPTRQLQFCTMFFFGLKEFQGCFVPMWNQVPAGNKNVACVYPNDTDGNAFRAGFEPLITESGYNVVDGGAYADGTTDFTSMISRLKAQRCEYLSNAPIPPDFSTFWKQASQQGWKPKLATVAKVLLFPADAVALGPLANNIATDSWWGPYMPARSALDGQSAASLASAYQAPHRQPVAAVDRVHLRPVRGGPPGVHRRQRPARQAGGRRRAAQGPLQRHVRAAELRWRPGARGGHHQPGRRAMETRHRRAPLRDEGRNNTLNPAVKVEAKLEPTNP